MNFDLHKVVEFVPRLRAREAHILRVALIDLWAPSRTLREYLSGLDKSPSNDVYPPSLYETFWRMGEEEQS
jgi:hypothetical protein